MRKTAALLIFALCLLVVGCRRNYKVIHARPVADTLVHDDLKTIEDHSMDEPVLEIPDPPGELDPNDVSQKRLKELDDLMKGK